MCICRKIITIQIELLLKFRVNHFLNYPFIKPYQPFVEKVDAHSGDLSALISSLSVVVVQTQAAG